jgi:hypothetical protein
MPSARRPDRLMSFDVGRTTLVSVEYTPEDTASPRKKLRRARVSGNPVHVSDLEAKGSIGKARPSRRGKLGLLPSLPLDVLYEVCFDFQVFIQKKIKFSVRDRSSANFIHMSEVSSSDYQ